MTALASIQHLSRSVSLCLSSNLFHLLNCVHGENIHSCHGRAWGTSPCVTHLHTCVLMASVCYCFHRTVDGSRGTWLTAVWGDKEDKALSTEPGERAELQREDWSATDERGCLFPGVTVCQSPNTLNTFKINPSSGLHTFYFWEWVCLFFMRVSKVQFEWC